MRPVLIIAVAFLATAGCDSTSGGEDTSATTSTTIEVTTTSSVPADEGSYEVEALGLTFRLPDNFEQFEDPELLFLARNSRPLAVLSIAGDDPNVVNAPARPGETLVELDLGGGITAVVVLNAALGGLPEGIVANELLVANGPWSFSAIMSASTEDLPELWDVFLRSVVLTPHAN